MNIHLIWWEQYMNPGYDRHVYLGPYSFCHIAYKPYLHIVCSVLNTKDDIISHLYY